MKYFKWKESFKNYVKNNYKEYLFICSVFIVGLFIGVFIINSCDENKKIQIIKYITEVIEKYKKAENIIRMQLIIQSIKNNLLFTFILWSAGTTVIGMPIVLLALLIRGALLGFTISSITITLGTFKGLFFCMAALVLHNIIYIPAIITLGVSSIKLYKSIMEDRRKENIKIAILRHTIISLIMVILLVLSAIMGNFISVSTLKLIIKYF